MDNNLDIRALRERIGWSQAQMAAFLCIDRSNVSRIEARGVARGPVLKLLKQLIVAAEAGDDAVAKLLGDEHVRSLVRSAVATGGGTE